MLRSNNNTLLSQERAPASMTPATPPQETVVSADPSPRVAAPRALAPKATAKGKPKLGLGDKIRLVKLWQAHVKAYRLSLGTLDEIIKPPQSDFERVHGLRRGAISEFETLMPLLEQHPESAQKHVRARSEVRKFYPVEALLKMEVDFLRSRKVTIDEWLLRLLGAAFYDHLTRKVGPMSFAKPKFSKGWVASFMKFWGLKRYHLKGEADGVDWKTIKEEVEKIEKTIAGYRLEDVYNADETGLFLQTPSAWTVDTECRSGTKTDTSRVSILFCVNAAGTDKRKPFILSTFFELRSMKCDYYLTSTRLIPQQFFLYKRYELSCWFSG